MKHRPFLNTGLLIGFLTCGLAVARPQPARAQAAVSAAEAEAEQRFRRGLDLYKDGDFAQALIEMKRAHSLAPNYRVLFNIGQVHFQLGEYADALKTFEKYLADGGAEIASDKQEAVRQDIAKLRLRVGRIEVETKAAGADVSVDDVPIGKTPLADLLVTAGRRRVTVTQAGQTVTRVVEVAGGEVAKVVIDFDAAAPPTAAALPTATTGPTPTSAPVTPPPEGTSLVWLPWTVTGLLAIGTGVCGGLALSASSDLTKAKDETAAETGAGADGRKVLEDKASSARTLALVTDILGVAAIAGLTVSIVVTATRGKGSSEKTAVSWEGPFGKGPARREEPAVRFGVTPGGVRVMGAF